jgi:hypothetical protein
VQLDHIYMGVTLIVSLPCSKDAVYDVSVVDVESEQTEVAAIQPLSFPPRNLHFSQVTRYVFGGLFSCTGRYRALSNTKRVWWIIEN